MDYPLYAFLRDNQPLVVVSITIVAVAIILLLARLSQVLTRQKELTKERLELDMELFKLEKFASELKRKRSAKQESEAESFWPKRQAQVERTPQGGMAPQEDSEQASQEEDEFADIRRENAVKIWQEGE